ncbi:MAG TPA: ABC transporter permease [Vicinamibacterales bacterium]|nr:ABC transporter permease [Vicinamibacterales bacterium]
MATLWTDLRYAGRLLWKTPAFTLVAVATLALGIGANTAIFSIVNAALLNPLPFPDSDRLVVVSKTVQRDTVERRPFSYPDYRDMRDRQQTFDALAAWSGEAFTLALPNSPARQVEGELASAGYFEMLGATPVAGRTFTKQEDDERDAHPVALISYALWQKDFGSDPATVGRAVTLNDRSFTIVGVLPRGFRGLDDDTEVWVPMGMLALAEPARFYDSRGARWHGVVARRKPGVSLAQANADVVTIARQLEQTYPDSNAKYGATALDLRQETVGQLQPLLLTMLAAVGFVLLIACVNLANLLLARASTRQRETAIRAALGADRRRLVAQFLAEGTILSLLGATGGLILSMWSVDAITALAPAGLPSFVVARLDWRVLLFVVAIACGAALLLGLLPALQGSRPDLNDALKDGMRGSSGGRERARVRSALVIAEVALSLLLLVGAGLMVRSFLNLQRVSVGFRADRAATLRLALPQKYTSDDLPRAAADLAARVAAVPGVAHAAVATDAPFSGGSSATIVSPEGTDTETAARGIRVYRHAVSPGFFAALGIEIAAGRDVDAHDVRGTQPIAIVSRRFAAKAWPGADPIGKRFTIGQPRGAQTEWIAVAGVVSDIRYRTLVADTSRAPEDPDVYFPFAQRPDRALSLVIGANAAPATLIAPAREAVNAFDRDIPTFGERTFSGLVAARTASFRLSAGVMSFFGAVALLLAGLGVYGLINYSVSQRRQEIGVRVALGARRSEIYGLVLKDAMRLVIAGLAIGLVASLPAARLIRAQLYGVAPADPVTYAVIAGLLLATGIGATLLPARRAARVDPIVALRAD